MQSARETTQYVADEARQMVGEQPLNSAVTVFGLGFGLGLLTALLLPEPPRSRRDEMMERMVDAMSRVVPDSVSRRMS
jgi:hypothetical protein